ncbi:phosphomethylpyrimidine synthase, partial [bacterium]
MTILEAVKAGLVPESVRLAAIAEGVSPEFLAQKIASGRAIVCANKNRREVRPLAIGEGLKVKVNSNIGTSKDISDLPMELEKLAVSLECKADTVMDLSTGGPLGEIRRKIIEKCPVPLGTVPLYQAIAESRIKNGGDMFALGADEIFAVIEEQAREGVDFMTVHCGINRESVRRMEG